MIRGSRPLRFVAIVIGGWIAIRVAMLWPATDPAPTPALVASTRDFLSTRRLAGPESVSGAASAIIRDSGRPITPRITVEHHRTGISAPAEPRSATGETAALPIDPRIDSPSRGKADLIRDESRLSPLPPAAPISSRWHGSAWLIARGGGGAAVPFAPQLGGSQAGARIVYALGESRRIAIAARVSAALSTKQREAAIGLDWRPTGLPIHLFAEQRIAIEGARGGAAVGVIAGLPPTRLPAGFALEGYGQAGLIARDRGEGFADAAVRAMRPVATLGSARVEIGGGLWGGAQRDAARLDIGPAASVIVPAGRPLRVSLEWRQRVAGNARSGAGVALSLGADF